MLRLKRFLGAFSIFLFVASVSVLFTNEGHAQGAGEKDALDARKMRSILIVDGSGSMWGRIGPKNKIVVVREVLPKSLAPFIGKMTLGIMSYGHRRKGQCSDIEVLVRPSVYTRAYHEKTLQRLRARGKTPISEALKRAARIFPKGSENNNIILLADGFENCARNRSDPCHVASKLKQEMPGLRVHVIAYGFKNTPRVEKSLKNLRCMATNTQGEFFRAYTRSELELVSSRLFATLWQQEKAIADRLLVERRMKPGVYLGAQLKKAGPFLKKGVEWLVFKGDDTPAPGAKPLLRLEEEGEKQYIDGLPSGVYFIRARYQGLAAGQPIRITKGRVYELNVVLEGGKINLATYSVIAGPLVPRIHYDIFRIHEEDGGTETQFQQLSRHQDRLLLPAGKYRIVAKVKNLALEKVIDLAAGDTIPVLFYVNGGQVELQTVLQEGLPPLEDVAYTVLRKSKDPDRPYAAFLRTRAPRPILELPADKYLLDIRVGLVNRTIPVTVEAGKNRLITINLNGGRLHLKKLKNGLEQDALPARHESGFRIYKEGAAAISYMQDSSKAIYATVQKAPSVIVPVGRYQIVSYEGASNAVRSVDLKAGEPQRTIEFNHSASEISMELQNLQGRRIVRNVFWKVRDQSGQVVFRSSLASPRTVLERGDYSVTAYYRGQELEKEVNVKVGRARKVIVKLR